MENQLSFSTNFLAARAREPESNNIYSLSGRTVTTRHVEVQKFSLPMSPSMLQGAANVSLHRSPDCLTLLVQHPSPRAEHPLPPHRPQSTGQQTLDASYPGRPFEHVWADTAVLTREQWKHCRREGRRFNCGGTTK